MKQKRSLSHRITISRPKPGSNRAGLNTDANLGDNPIRSYFANYPSFSYRPSSDWRQLSPFHALAKHCGWSNERRKEEFKRFKSNWTKVVECEFSGSSISHYQSVCEDLDVTPIPQNVEECKAVLRRSFVNIVDLMQYRADRKGRRVATKPRKFRTLNELKQYSRSSGKYYAKEEAKAEMLRELLRVLL